jgi:outer membrane protein OmpA-like peptidoglycan-associated protein
MPLRAAAALLLGAMLLMSGCATSPPEARPTAELAPLPPRTALPLDAALLALATRTLTEAEATAFPPGTPPGARRTIVIDPLIDRVTGAETAATRSMGAQVETLIRERHPRLELKAFSLESLDEQPLIFLGAMSTAASAGSLQMADGPAETYRIWAVIGDLRTGRILSHPTAWVRAETVDVTPTAFYRDSPVWAPDAMRAAYLRTCAGNPGDPIDPVYLRGLRAQAEVAAAIRAYEEGRPERALALYRSAAEAPAGGQQQRVLNGLYLASWALGRRDEAEEAFARLVDDGLANDRLAVRLLFRPGSTAFLRDPAITGAYPMWLRQIADRTAARPGCLLVSGHTSLTGSPAVNDRLSLARAQSVRARLIGERAVLAQRSRAEGKGSQQPLVGLGTDDLRDALDRRVEFAPRPCPEMIAGG